ncbi:hypothetical protein [Novosphingobium sp. KN65.2]|uniref:hypothetical protein n=1 Tax=Novosphingobium sp. KN65.2 TaxID=1478134 RepID=UPI0005DE1D3D|nr:hypothetical protein [Novosphingobium sp. KN65.2]CDO36012.1 hypothetical protein SPHV1_2290028 [Novosphingobium sp. KN65.2]
MANFPLRADSARANPIHHIPGFRHSFPAATPRRAEVEALIDRLIGMLDRLDGDPDLEETDLEDSFVLSPWALDATSGPGCAVADIDKAIDDDPCDADSDSEPDEDDFNFPLYGLDQSEAEAFPPSADRTLLRRHRDYIRRTRCRRLDPTGASWGPVEYRLL